MKTVEDLVENLTYSFIYHENTTSLSAEVCFLLVVVGN